jgi:CPA2 family monovalent cation:H+ antiporter-2
MESAILYTVIALGISVVINLFLKKFGISQIIGYIITGTLITYMFDLQHVADSHILELIGEFGIVFLMFTIGLEISLEKMKLMRTEVFFNGFLQVGVSSVVFYLISHFIFEINTTTSIIISLAMSLSSTAVVLSYLKSSKQIHQPYGQRAMGILIFQDLAVIPILLLIGFLSVENVDLNSVLSDTFTSAVIVIGLLFLAGKPVMTWLLHFSAESNIEELFMGSVLVILMGASLFAHYMGFTYSLGAFVAGMVIAETKYHHKVESDIASFKDLLLGTFFVTVGMKIDISYFIHNITEIILLIIVIFTIKTAIIFATILITSKKDVALKTALSLAQVGEFSFAIFALASSASLIDHELVILLILVVIVSMLITPFMISKIDEVVIKLFKEEPYDNDFVSLQERHNHIIVCGYSVVGKFVARDLELMGVEHIIIDNSLKHVKEALKDGKKVYYGDMSKSSILSALHVENASAIIVTLDNFEKKYIICEALQKFSKDVRVVVKVISLEEKEALEALDIGTVIDSKKKIAHILVDEAKQCKI